MSGLLCGSVPLGGKETDVVGKDKEGVAVRHVPGKVAKTPRPTFVGIPILRGSQLNLSCRIPSLLNPRVPWLFPSKRASLLLFMSQHILAPLVLQR